MNDITLYVCRYQPPAELASRLTELHHQVRLARKQRDRLATRTKISQATEIVGLSLDNEAHQDLLQVAAESTSFINSMPEDSFGRVFWEQQMEAASKKDARSMRWHPLMIRWCIGLKHRYIESVYYYCYILL